MTITNNLRKLVHRKAWEFASPMFANTANGAFVDTIKDPDHPFYNMVFFVNGASGVYMYDTNEDAWIQLPNSGIAGAFNSGSCGDMLEIGSLGGVTVQNATAGTTTTITTNRNIVRSITGAKIRVIAGAGMGYEGVVSSNTLGASSVLTVSPASTIAFNSTTMYEVYSGSLLFFNAGTSSVGLSLYDIATNFWISKSVVGLPTSFASDGQLVSTTNMPAEILTGNATSATATTLVTNKNLVINQVANYAVRIVTGTGAGQSRTIISSSVGPNTTFTTSSATTALTAMTRAATGVVVATVASSAALNMIPGRGFTITGASDATFNGVYVITAISNGVITLLGTNTTVQATAQTGTGQDTWIVTPDASSLFVVEGDYNTVFLGGNASVALYRYNLGSNLWVTVTPTVARSGSPGGGFTMDVVNSVPNWNEGTNSTPHFQGSINVKQNGRYIYSLRGGGSNILDFYDIATNTWLSNAPYGNQFETFNSGSHSWEDDGVIYVQKEGTGRVFQFDIDKNVLLPFAVIVYPNSSTVTGDKMFTKKFIDGVGNVNFFYSMFHSRAELCRTLII